jgi:hypothetical protein
MADRYRLAILPLCRDQTLQTDPAVADAERIYQTRWSSNYAGVELTSNLTTVSTGSATDKPIARRTIIQTETGFDNQAHCAPRELLCRRHDWE